MPCEMAAPYIAFRRHILPGFHDIEFVFVVRVVTGSEMQASQKALFTPGTCPGLTQPSM